jgi:hypothetical protein
MAVLLYGSSIFQLCKAAAGTLVRAFGPAAR